MNKLVYYLCYDIDPKSLKEGLLFTNELEDCYYKVGSFYISCEAEDFDQFDFIVMDNNQEITLPIVKTDKDNEYKVINQYNEEFIFVLKDKVFDYIGNKNIPKKFFLLEGDSSKMEESCQLHDFFFVGKYS